MLNNAWSDFIESVTLDIYSDVCTLKAKQLRYIDWDAVEKRVGDFEVDKQFARSITEAMDVWDCIKFVDGFTSCTIGTEEVDFSICPIYRDMYCAVAHIVIIRAVLMANRLNYNLDGFKDILKNSDELRDCTLYEIERCISMSDI